MDDRHIYMSATPPPGFEWQIGKTAASIRFVNHAELFLKDCKNLENKFKLERFINEVKEGKVDLNEWLTPEEYLNNKFFSFKRS